MICWMFWTFFWDILLEPPQPLMETKWGQHGDNMGTIWRQHGTT